MIAFFPNPDTCRVVSLAPGDFTLPWEAQRSWAFALSRREAPEEKHRPWQPSHAAAAQECPSRERCRFRGCQGDCAPPLDAA